MPTLVKRERPDPLRQNGQDLIEVPPGVQPGVEQHNGNTDRIAPLDVRHLKAIPKHGQMHHAPILSDASTSGRSLRPTETGYAHPSMPGATR